MFQLSCIVAFWTHTVPEGVSINCGPAYFVRRKMHSSFRVDRKSFPSDAPAASAPTVSEKKKLRRGCVRSFVQQ